MDLVHCVYCSAAAKEDFSRADLDKLLANCREKNARLGVTGMLLFSEGSFLQVLEGDRPVVETLFQTISRDARHERVTKIILEPIASRDFAQWTMGYSRITTKELATIPGLNDFFARGTSYIGLSEGRAKTLLNAFREGKWRMSIA